MPTTALIDSHSLLDDERAMAALAPARLAFGRLSAIIETPRLAGLQGWDRSGGWLEQIVYAMQLHQAARCICDTIAWWWQTL